jgi:hypothetical protein
MVRLDAAGDAFVVWYDNGSVYAAIHPSGGSWLPTGTVGVSSLAGLGVDSAGNATVLSGNGSLVYAVDRAWGGTWSPPKVVDSPTNLSAPASLAVTPDGQAVAVWETYDRAPDPEMRTNYVVHASRRASFAGAWGPAATLSTALKQNYGHAVAVGMDPMGDAVVVGRQLTGDPIVVEAVAQSPTGAWSSAVTVSTPGTTSGYPALAVDGAGNVTAAWTNVSTGAIESATGLIPANTWTAPVQVSAVGVQTGYPAVAGNDAGAAVVTWPAGSKLTQVQAAVRPTPMSPWIVTTVRVAPNQVSGGLPALDATGRAVLVWNETPASWIGQITATSTYLP